MRRSAWGAALALAVVLAGCTRNTVVFVLPVPPRPGADPACNAPPGTAPVTGTGRVVAVGILSFPPQASQARIPLGCAGVLFHVAPDGRTVDLRVVVENPPGFGFGDAALQSVGATRFQPNPLDKSWHYIIATLRAPRAMLPPRPGAAPGYPAPMPPLPPPDYSPGGPVGPNPFHT